MDSLDLSFTETRETTAPILHESSTSSAVLLLLLLLLLILVLETSHDIESSKTDTCHTRSRSSTISAFLHYIDDEPQDHAKMKGPRQKLVFLYRLLVLELNLPENGSAKMTSPDDRSLVSKAQEQLTNMVKIPYHLEKFICFGLLVCANAFLTLFTLVPLKIAIVCGTAFKDYVSSSQRDISILVRKVHFVKRDLITLLLIVASVALLSTPLLEVSRLYHDIRGQAHIKLYVMFGVLEVTDRLFSSIAQEIFTVLVGLPLTNMTSNKLAEFVFFSLVALVFFACHSYTLIYQSVALHVAANSYSNALLALLLSNQFSELKGAVFKKFEREGLFQVTMSDLTERFQLSIMISVITLRNLSQLSNIQLGLIPDSWKSWNKWFGAIFGPTVVVLGSEILVDWIKHCYINKFNLIRPRIYENFLYVLCSDFREIFTSNTKTNTLHEVSDYILLTKRIGLPIISLTIWFLRMALKDLRQFFMPSSMHILSVLASIVLVTLAFVILLVARLLLSLCLLKWAEHIKHAHDMYQESLRSTSKTYSLDSQSFETHVDDLKNDSGQTDVAITPPPKQQIDGRQKAHFDSFSKGPAISTPIRKPDNGILSDANIASPTDSEIDLSFLPGIPNTASSSINPKTRLHLYDHGESVPLTLEEKRNAQFIRRRATAPAETSNHAVSDSLHQVHRYDMSSKMIW